MSKKNKTDISGLATKTSLNDYLQTLTFNSKVTEVENKIKDADIIAKSAVTKANTIRSDLTDYAKKAEVATDITTIKNDYVSNASLTSRLNDLKSQHIATEVKIKTTKKMKMKEGLVLIEDFSIIFKNVIMYMNVNLVHLMLILIKKYLNGDQQVFLIILVVPI